MRWLYSLSSYTRVTESRLLLVRLAGDAGISYEAQTHCSCFCVVSDHVEHVINFSRHVSTHVEAREGKGAEMRP